MRLIVSLIVVLLTGAMSGSVAAEGPQNRPRLQRYQVAAGTALLVKLRTPLDTATASVDDQVEATIWSPVIQNDAELIPEGSVVLGKVVEVTRASLRYPSGKIVFLFSIVEHAGTGSREMVHTQKIRMEAPRERDEKGRDTNRFKPIDAVVPAGTPLVAMTAEPLTVLIPR